ncbi:hypothetical protein V2J09_013303 [Rumex salicifolius]
MDLANTLQRSNEVANDFIDWWRNMLPKVHYNLISKLAVHVGNVEPRSFDALVSKACNIERQIERRKASTIELK